MRRTIVLAGGLALAACYDPTYQDLACSPSGACPDGYECLVNLCVRSDLITDDGGFIDSPAPDAIDATEIDAVPVDAAIDAVPPCPPGDVTSPTDPTRCFTYRSATLPWAMARDACAAMGGALADVRNAQENVALIDLARTQATWLGGTDVATEGTWLWTDGTPFGFNAWAEGQPNGGAQANCVRFVGMGALGFGPSDWTDLACSQANPSFCVHAP